jgi:GNAT superfamily N-acetyltransferase
MNVLRLIRYRSEYLEPMLALHRSVLEGIDLGMTQQDEEADLVAIEEVYLRGGGEFLVGFLNERFAAMGGFMRLTPDSAKLRRMRIQRDLQGKGYGSQLRREVESRASASGVRTMSLEAARRRPLTLEFYRKHGYRETGTGFYGQIEMVKYRKDPLS